MALIAEWAFNNSFILILCFCVGAFTLKNFVLGGRKLDSAPPSPETQSEISKRVGENKVMMFSKSYCPYCTRAKNELSMMNVEFAVLELDVSIEAFGCETFS